MKRTFVIAEAGVNHNGDIALARRLVQAAAEAGADAVKFQTFRAEDLSSASAEMADYQKRNIGRTTSQLEMLKSLELPLKAHAPLKEMAESLGIEFMSTPFDPKSLDFLVREIGLKRLKLGSGELTNGPLLFQAGRTNLPLILSTGMGTIAEVGQALQILASANRGEEPGDSSFEIPVAADPALKNRLTLLHCVTDYPVPDHEVNLLAMDLLLETYGIPVGYSDHTIGAEASLAAVARGAKVIEKHLTLDPSLPGPDQAASLAPEDFGKMVLSIRKIESILGQKEKLSSVAERKNAAVARKSLVALKPIRAGEPFSRSNLGVKRPGSGISPMKYWQLLGKKAAKDFREDDLITE